jgi:toxin ParE1/3/4
LIFVEFTSDADADLDSILEYSVEMFGVETAEAYLLDLNRAIQRLSQYPEIGFLRTDLRQRPRCLSCREHHIFYRFDGASVLVGRILHKAVDPARWLT